MTNYGVAEFYGVLFVFGSYLFISAILIKGLTMLTDYFFDKKRVVFHHHFHYKDRRKWLKNFF